MLPSSLTWQAKESALRFVSSEVSHTSKLIWKLSASKACPWTVSSLNSSFAFSAVPSVYAVRQTRQQCLGSRFQGEAGLRGLSQGPRDIAWSPLGNYLRSHHPAVSLLPLIMELQQQLFTVLCNHTCTMHPSVEWCKDFSAAHSSGACPTILGVLKSTGS